MSRDVFKDVDCFLDINDPKLRWAQHIADKTGEKQVIVANILGGLDIKRQSAVPIIFNDDVKAIIEPKEHRIPNKLNGENHGIN